GISRVAPCLRSVGGQVGARSCRGPLESTQHRCRAGSFGKTRTLGCVARRHCTDEGCECNCEFSVLPQHFPSGPPALPQQPIDGPGTPVVSTCGHRVCWTGHSDRQELACATSS